MQWAWHEGKHIVIEGCVYIALNNSPSISPLHPFLPGKDFVVDSDAECQTLLRPEVESFEPAVPNEVPEVKQVERPPNPFVKPAEPANPFQNTKFAGLSPKAMNWREIG